MSFFGFGEKRGAPPGAEKFVAPKTGKAPELSVRRSEGGLDKTPKQTPKSVLAERYHQAREMPASVRAKVFGEPESMNAPFDVTEKEIDRAVNELMPKKTLRERMTTISEGKVSPVKERLGGRAMIDEGAVNVKAKSFDEMQASNIRNLKHQVDMSSAIELDATGTDDEPFEVEHGPQQFRKTGTR
jgi:hypothetical protein